VVIVWFLLRSVADKKEEILNSFANANYLWVGLSMIVIFLSHFLRAYRWNYLLEPLGYKTTLLHANQAVLIGYLANYGLPRMGEVTRCTIVAKTDNVPFEVGLGTVITERIVDFVLLMLIFVLTLLAQFNKLKDLASYYIFDPMMLKIQALTAHPVLLALVIALLLGVVIAFLLLRKRMATMLKGKFGKIIKGFGEGIVSIRNMKRKGRFILLSLGIWASYYFSLYLCFFAFTETSQLGLGECLTLLLFGTFGVIFTPGGLGVYQALIQNLLLGYGISAIAAFAFPWLTWTTQFILVGSMGGLSLILLLVSNRKKKDVVSQ